MGFGKERVRSMPDAVAKVLKMHFDHLNKTGEVSTSNDHEEEINMIGEMEQPALLAEGGEFIDVSKPKEKHFDICKECGQALLAREEGCAKCYGCGYAEC